MDNENKKIWLYHLFEDQLGTYRLMDYTWKAMDVKNNIFQYCFDSDNKYFTSGDSFDNNNCVLKLVKGKLHEILTVEQTECIFPLATNGSEYYFVMRKDDHKAIRRDIVTFDKGKLKVIISTSHLISEGAMIKNYLFYTVYDNNENTYDLYRVDLLSNNKEFVRMKTGLISGKLYTYKDKLYYSDGEKIYNEEKEFEKKDLNFFIENMDLLMQLHLNGSAEVVLSIFDINRNKVLREIKEVINYEFEGNKLIVYCHDKIENMVLK